jgi:hypothetical protein
MAVFIIVIIIPLAVVVFLQRRSKRRFWFTLVIAASLVATIAIYAFPHCVPLETLNRVQPGIMREQAIELLGQPFATKQFSDGRSRLGYQKPFRYCNVDVLIDPAGHVTGVYHDH